jgi:hypothetical protein
MVPLVICVVYALWCRSVRSRIKIPRGTEITEIFGHNPIGDFVKMAVAHPPACIRVGRPLLTSILTPSPLPPDIPYPRWPTPRRFFEWYFTREIRDEIFTSTNASLSAKDMNPMTRREWTAYVGHVVWLMVHPAKSLRRAWEEWWGADAKSPHGTHLTLHRFEEIYASIAFHSDTLHTLLNARLSEVVPPGQHLTFDETRHPCQINSGPDRQYISHNPKKPDVHAIEAITACADSGLMCYVGDPFHHPPNTAIEETVFALRTFFSWQDRPHVVADRRFGSYLLATTLEQLGYPFTINCRVNTPASVFQNNLADNLPAFHARVGRVGEIVGIAYKSTHKFCLLSTAFSVSSISPVMGKENPLAAVDLYTTHNGKVDDFNHLLRTFRFGHRHQSARAHWFDCLLNICIINAYLLSRIVSPSPPAHVDFLRSISTDLLSNSW